MRTVFQLVKTYGDVARPIAKPVEGSVVVAVDGDGVEAEVDVETGAVTLDAAPDEGAVVTAGFLFDTPVRFDADRIENFRVTRNQTLYIRDRQDRVFEVNTSGACTDLDSTFGIALHPGTGSISRLCTGDWTNVLVRGQTRGTGPCRAQVTRMLTDEQVALLPERDRP